MSKGTGDRPGDKPYTIGRLKGNFALIIREANGKRRRFRLGTADQAEAERLAEEAYAMIDRAENPTRKVGELWSMYRSEKSDRSIYQTMGYTWKALERRFGHLEPEQISFEHCQAHIEERRRQGRGDGTIHTELGHLRMVLLWAEGRNLIDRAPKIERPSKPAPKERHMTREEFRMLMDTTEQPHLRIAFRLMISTGARISALLELTWDRVDTTRRMIFLRDREDKRKLKGRATVRISETLAADLMEARKYALTDHVIEWGGEPIKSIKRGVATAAKKAGLEGITPHVFRHTAAVWLAEDGHSMEEIAQFLGHSNTKMTREVYARFSPAYMDKLTASLDI